MTVVWKERGEWGKEAYTAEQFSSVEELRQAAKVFGGVLSCVAVYGNISKDKALEYYFKANTPR